MFKTDTKIANPGNIVEFERNETRFKGKVIPSQCQRSVIVDLTIMENFEEIDFDYERTVVAHENYRILS
ncbi:YkvS family protein [Halobacillus amylolyticus]|uniref:YkvS family protein n=1 Tax=Halobacillus amylolyticus TaxID=2932259 RepID=A0ABY4HAG7_9BACI|nr:YkvS family protein [Halobacillus amylolyticus]UOR11657.1 YkvS family protein [Halobacillus amylolyticus]